MLVPVWGLCFAFGFPHSFHSGTKDSAWRDLWSLVSKVLFLTSPCSLRSLRMTNILHLTSRSMPISPEEAQRITLATYDATAEWYAQTHSDIAEMKPQLDTFIGLLPASAQTLLDIWCGPGRDARYFVLQWYEVTGIDTSEKLLEIARQQVPTATFLLADMRTLSFDLGSFAGIWSCASLLHLPKVDVPATLQLRQQLLQSGGVIFVGVKAGTGEHMIQKDYYLGHEKFFAFYELPELTKLITDAGFEIIQIDMDAKRDAWCNVFARKG